MFSILLGDKCYHVIPHPKRKDKKIIRIMLKQILKDL